MTATGRATAREQEAAAAAGPSQPPAPPPYGAPGSTVAAMLARRGFRCTAMPLDLPFDPSREDHVGAAFAALLDHYGFRLFLRGAILSPDGFTPASATKYLDVARAEAFAERLVDLGMAERLARGAYRLAQPPRNFGSTLEWYVARALRVDGGFDTAVGLKFGAPGVGGDLDVVAAADGSLIYLELKSSPPKHVSTQEVGAFIDRVRALRPHVALFVVDTALRLADKVLPLFDAELRARGSAAPVPQRIERELWALTPHAYVVNARPDLLANVRRAIAAGLAALAPPPL